MFTTRTMNDWNYNDYIQKGKAEGGYFQGANANVKICIGKNVFLLPVHRAADYNMEIVLIQPNLLTEFKQKLRVLVFNKESQ